MTTPDLQGLAELVSASTGPCLSIFLPTHRTHVEVKKDRIRLDNALRRAEQLVEASGTADAALLDPIRALRDDSDFWAHQEDGLALFSDGGGLKTFRVAKRLEEQVVLDHRPYIKPLVPDAAEVRFRLLALSQHSVRLFAGNGDGLVPVEVPDLPQRVEDVVGEGAGEHDPEGADVASAEQHQKADLEKFVRAVDEALAVVTNSSKLPLVVAAVDHVASAFRHVSRKTIAGVVSGNPDQRRPADLHAEARPIVEGLVAAQQTKLDDQIRQGLGTGKVVQRMDEVVAAARAGRVDTMVVARDVVRWGVALPSGTVEVHDERQPGDVDLINLAAVECLTHGGKVLARPQADLPGDDPRAVAILRY